MRSRLACLSFMVALFPSLTAGITYAVPEGGDVEGRREREGPPPPKAASVKEDKDTKGQARERLTVNVYHGDPNEVKCPVHEKHSVCRDTSHWKVGIKGQDYSDPENLRKRLKQDADTMRTDPQNPQVSEQMVMIRADASAPFGVVQSAMNACARVGIYKIEVGAARPSEERREGKSETPPPAPAAPSPSGGERIEEKTKTDLPRDPGVSQGQPARMVLEEIRVFIRWDPAAGKTTRNVGNLKPVTSDAELMQIILSMTADYKRLGKMDFPILIDATREVPWQDVVHVLDVCKREHLDWIEFAAPLEYKPGAK